MPSSARAMGPLPWTTTLPSTLRGTFSVRLRQAATSTSTKPIVLATSQADAALSSKYNRNHRIAG